MANIREILAQNLKENRRKLGITQPELAERAGLSTHYLGMIEIGRNFPTANVLERLAAALGINPHELFSVAVSPERAMEQLQQSILDNMDRVYQTTAKNLEKAVADAVEKAVSAQFNGREGS